MADGRAPGVVPVPLVQLSAPPAQPIAPLTQPIQPKLNWSHFKPEFIDKSKEDVETHLLRNNDWMDTHAFPDGVKVQCLLFNISRRYKIMV